MSTPNLYIIAGCNGAGKTTTSFNVLPHVLGCKEFVNADEIAKGLSPFYPETVAIQAGKLMLQRIDTLLSEGVSEGGHNISEATIHRRYRLGIKNLFEIFMPIVDYWALYDNNMQTTMIADSGSVENPDLFNTIKKQSCQNKRR